MEHEVNRNWTGWPWKRAVGADRKELRFWPEMDMRRRTWGLARRCRTDWAAEGKSGMECSETEPWAERRWEFP